MQSASTSTGANVFQYTYTSGSPYNDDWILEKVKGMADIYSFNKTNNYYDINTSDCADDLSSDFDSMGYDGYSMLNSSASMAYTYLPLDTIWVFCGHGMRTGTSNGELGGGIWFGNSGGRIYAKGGSNSTLTKYINNSPSLSSERCIIYNACYSGLTHSTLGNLVDEAYNKGAKLVIGFTSTVGVRPGCYWNELFFEKSCDGGTVLESMSHADYWSDFLWNDPGGTEQRYVRGSTSQKLIY
ncbi:MAG: hypothetical protein BWY74_03140 [Firmicutes bacterium ADurb.Bin419]|nr:MAG: hypothetical protein BWY74_03140 [Firmicutes bacterium ADurb.Bin419]